MKYFKKNRTPILGGVLVTALVIFLQVSSTPMVVSALDKLDALLYDLRLELMLDSTPELDRSIKIIDIDERSLKEEGRWPWSRTKIARLIEQLADAGVDVVTFDVVFSEPERNAAEQLIHDLRLRNALTESQQTHFESLVDTVSNERYMATHLGDTKVVLGAILHTENAGVGSLGEPVATVPDEFIGQMTLTAFPGFTGPMPILQQAAARVGFVNAQPDMDGKIRHSPMILRNGNAIYPSLSLATFIELFGLSSAQPVFVKHGAFLGLRGVQIADYVVPTDIYGNVTISYQSGPYSYDYLSATDVLAGKYGGGQLAGNVVFVGTSALGLADLRSTPLSATYPGVEAHAVMLESMLERRVPYKPSWEIGLVVVVLFLLGLLLSLLQPVLKPLWLIGVSLLALVAVIGTNFYLWKFHLFDLTSTTPILVILLISLWNIGYSLVQENNQRQAIKSMFGQYVPPQHVDLMINNAENYNGDGESRELSVMFADVRNFTTISESLTAAELKRALNRFFTPITAAIFENDGTIDKYVGDMVMAFWGAPLPDKNHRKHAIDAAFAMLEATENLKASFAADGLPEFNIGIGINTGQMNVGDMGSEFRRAYTVLGDSVNLGSRIESLTKFYGAKLLVSEFVVDGVDDYVFLFTDKIIVKGKNEAIEVYQPIGLKGDVDDKLLAQIDLMDQALAAYRQRSWDKAIELLQKVSAFKHLRDLYIERILSLQGENLDDDWDGVYRHTSK